MRAATAASKAPARLSAGCGRHGLATSALPTHSRVVVVGGGIIAVEFARIFAEAKVPVRLRPPPEEGNACEIQGATLQKWLDKSGDPESEIEGWCDEGVGIGINRPIKYCNVFLRVSGEEARAEARPERADRDLH